ncbi:MAG: sulfotransferase [Actinomycetota bacterium]|nr:sulfotransferase [Actinomycetota bacterium]
MKVLYVLGRGRSGSTIFSNVLGELDGFFSGGEIRYLWDPIVVQRSTCGCGRPIAACSVWSHVLAKVGDLDLEQVIAWQHEIVREHQTYRILRHPRRGLKRALNGFAEVMNRVYVALAEVTGARVIVDSSKRPSYAAFLESMDSLVPHYVHLVREPRASAYSWRHRNYDSAQGGGRKVTQRNAFDATLRWDLLNLGSEVVVRKAGRRAATIRYEDFVAEPTATVRRVARLLDEDPDHLPFIGERRVRLGTNHTIAGNPARFRTGVLELEDRSDWRTGQSRSEAWVSTLVALPFLRRYGYGRRPTG